MIQSVLLLQHIPSSLFVICYETCAVALLSEASLCEAILVDADLSGTDLSGADLSGADLTGANLTGIILDDATVIDTVFRNNAGLTDRLRADLQQRGAIVRESAAVIV